jgi:hypothetical protein
MDKLTDFQKKCEILLKNQLKTIGKNVDSWAVINGKTETYIEGDIHNLRFWIYEDEAEIKGEKIDQHFEHQDYENDLDLINDFVSSLINLLKGNPPPKQWVKGDRINLIDLGPL